MPTNMQRIAVVTEQLFMGLREFSTKPGRLLPGDRYDSSGSPVHCRIQAV
jgi:hypothetical protein